MNIVRAQDGRLWDGEQCFRFFGLAAPNLHLQECQLYPDRSNRFPDDYEIADILVSIHQAGGRATRVFSLSLQDSREPDLACHIVGIQDGRVVLNEQAMRTLDAVLYWGEKTDVRVIIPLIDSHSFRGWRGVDEWAVWSGKDGKEFWTDPQLRSQFKNLMGQLCARRNTRTGRLYRDEPALLAWQLGNELDSWPADRGLDRSHWLPKISAWSIEMARELKVLDPQHLVMEGGGLLPDFLAEPAIDVISLHCYEYWNKRFGKNHDLSEMLKAVLREIAGKKPLIVDEFGMASLENCQSFMHTVCESTCSGALLWSIRGHHRDGGFYQHNENGSGFNSYHWPGFSTGALWDEQTLLNALVQAAHRIGNPAKNLNLQTTPLKPGPNFPTNWPSEYTRPMWKEARLMPEARIVLLRWRGVSGAKRYQLEKAIRYQTQGADTQQTQGGKAQASKQALQGENLVWVCINSDLHDTSYEAVASLEEQGGYERVPFFLDTSPLPGQNSYYRLRAQCGEVWLDWSDTVELRSR